MRTLTITTVAALLLLSTGCRSDKLPVQRDTRTDCQTTATPLGVSDSACPPGSNQDLRDAAPDTGDDRASDARVSDARATDGPSLTDGSSDTPDASTPACQTHSGEICNLPPGIAAVWAVHDGEKVEQDDLSHPAKHENTAWDGHTIRVFGGKNEIVSFQIIVEGADEGVRELSVSLPELRHPSGEVLRYNAPGEDPTHYVDRPIQIFTEHYMDIVEPTDASWIAEPGEAASPKDMLGKKPVQLIPENAAPGRGGLPLQVSAHENQGLWFDLYLGRDLPAGVFRGAVELKTESARLRIPIEVEVFDFELPDTNAVHYLVYYESSQVSLYHGQNLDERYHRFAHRHRIEFVHGYDVERAKQAMPRLTGTAFTTENGYSGPGENIGNTLVPRTMYGPGGEFETENSAVAASNAWMEFLNSELPGKITFLYMPDEPPSSQYDYIRRLAGYVHENPGPGGDLPIFVTRRYTGSLDAAIDRWCATAGGFDPERAEIERSHGDDLWYYNGARPHIGSLIIDSPATDARVHGWGTFKHEIPVYFYWHANHWRHNGNAPEDYPRVQNVWEQPMTFINRSGEFANGDGVLVYPGQDVLHADQDRGIEGPIGTVQLANLRRGAQDHAYLSLARQRGLDELIAQALQRIVPKVYAECTSAVCFPESGDPYE